ncbi:FecR family protein [Parafilimonas sp.]|uniref:FecR family protein n=1 Tax=Parafilimonas sp. TaxID=1969739 RepID=UPI0039E49208
MNIERIWVLLAKRKSGEATDEELAELNDLLHREAGNTENEIVEKIWNAPLQPLNEIKPEDLWNKIERSTGKTVAKPFDAGRISTWLAAAAVVTAVIAGVFLLGPKKENSVAFSQNITTQPASKKHLVLPDGTNVWLNGNSALSYNDRVFGERYREVNLTGEAFFDVTKDAAHPFIIHASSINITVKGTAFNVKAFPGQKNVETSLVRGLVEITTRQDPERKILLRPNEKISVSAEKEPVKQAENKTEQPLFIITKLHTDEKDVLPETVWMNSSLAFDNESLEQLAPKLESWFSVTLHVDENMKEAHFTGTITKETLQQTLDAMKLSSPFGYEIKNNEVWIHK